MKWDSQFADRTLQMKRSAVRELLKLTNQPGMISFAGGLPAPELFPLDEIELTAQTVLREVGSRALQYGETEGLSELRDWVASSFSKPGFEVRRDNVLIVSGGQQGLDLIGRVLLNEGDRVIVENPTYLALLSAWRPLGVRFLPVPSDAAGLRVDCLPSLLEQRPKLIYTIPTFQNPQGSTLGLNRRRELAELVRKYGVGLVEDNPYGELRYSGEPLPHLFHLNAALGSTQSCDESEVIYVGTFSKVLAPGLRIGWIIAARPVIEKLVQAKQAVDLQTGTFAQHIVRKLIVSGVLEKQIPRLRQAYRERRDTMLAAMSEHFPEDVTWTEPDGGMFLMVTLPQGLNAADLLREALKEKVAFVPGEEFHLEGMGTNTMRLNFSNAQPEKIQEGIRRLAEVFKRCLCAA